MQENRRKLTGTVVSNKMTKSVVVQVERQFNHPVFHKMISRQKKYMAHDEENTCQIGDLVQITESRPLSARKRWIVTKVLQRTQEE